MCTVSSSVTKYFLHFRLLGLSVYIEKKSIFFKLPWHCIFTGPQTCREVLVKLIARLWVFTDFAFPIQLQDWCYGPLCINGFVKSSHIIKLLKPFQWANIIQNNVWRGASNCPEGFVVSDNKVFIKHCRCRGQLSSLNVLAFNQLLYLPINTLLCIVAEINGQPKKILKFSLGLSIKA